MKNNIFLKKLKLSSARESQKPVVHMDMKIVLIVYLLFFQRRYLRDCICAAIEREIVRFPKETALFDVKIIYFRKNGHFVSAFEKSKRFIYIEGEKRKLENR